jgi:hypothetical protein
MGKSHGQPCYAELTTTNQLLEELYAYCSKGKFIFPSLEAFEERMNNPVVYYYFYDRFFRSAVGEQRWRQSLKSDNKIARMGSVQAEAFAMILLKNNYFAWLMETKEKVPEGRTDYDSNLLTNGQDYKELNFHLNSEIDVESDTFQDSDYCVLADMDDYKEHQEANLSEQKEVRKRARKNKQYRPCWPTLSSRK